MLQRELAWHFKLDVDIANHEALEIIIELLQPIMLKNTNAVKADQEFNKAKATNYEAF